MGEVHAGSRVAVIIPPCCIYRSNFCIFLAIIAVGFNVAYGLIIGRARKAGTAELRFALRTVRFMDDYVANPSTSSCW